MVKNAEKTKNDLKKFAQQLRDLKHPTSPISIELADFVASALENFLSEDRDTSETLDSAFGFVEQPKKQGRPPKETTERTAIIERYISLRLNTEFTEEKICGMLEEEGLTNGQHVSTIVKMVDKAFNEVAPRLVANEIAKELSEEKTK